MIVEEKIYLDEHEMDNFILSQIFGNLETNG